jgi:hypothetical protein
MKHLRFSIRNLVLLAVVLLVPTMAQAQSRDAKPGPKPVDIPCTIIKTRETISGQLSDKYHVKSVNNTGAQLQTGQTVAWKIFGDNHYANGTQMSVPLNKPIGLGANFTVSAWSIAVDPNKPFSTQPLTCKAWLVKPQSPNLIICYFM